MTKLKNPVTLSAIAGLVILESIALIMGINGAAFGICIAAIAGLAGYKIKPPTKPS